VATVIHGGTDFLEMFSHGKAVAKRHDQASALALFRAYGTKDIDPFRTLILWSGWPTSTFRPPASDLVFLAYSGFVLEPDFEFGSCG
jgi:hypothetical protein